MIRPFQKTIQVPGDKSISHRSVLLGAIAEGTTEIEGFLPGADCLSTIACFQQLGVSIETRSETSVTVHGKGWSRLEEAKNPLYVGNSGTTICLLLGILAGAPLFSTVCGDASIAQRPMDRVVHPLRKMGAQIDGREDGTYTPLAVRGTPLQGISYQSPVASAQVKSSLLLAGLQAQGTTTVQEPALSRDHTERMLSAFGVQVNRKENEVSVDGGQQLVGTSVQVPGDLSSAAFFLAAALVVPGSRLTVTQVGLNPTRTGILDAFRQMGAEVTIEQTDLHCGEPIGNVTVSCDELQAIEVDGETIPRLIDEVPILAVVATQAKGVTVTRDAAELKVKESNRIATVASELRNIGADIEETEDGLIINGPTHLSGGVCHSHGDHRIGMAMEIAGLAAKEKVKVEGTDAIGISFPNFYSILEQITG